MGRKTKRTKCRECDYCTISEHIEHAEIHGRLLDKNIPIERKTNWLFCRLRNKFCRHCNAGRCKMRTIADIPEIRYNIFS